LLKKCNEKNVNIFFITFFSLHFFGFLNLININQYSLPSTRQKSRGASHLSGKKNKAKFPHTLPLPKPTIRQTICSHFPPSHLSGKSQSEVSPNPLPIPLSQYPQTICSHFPPFPPSR